MFGVAAECRSMVDVIFVLDISGSARYTHPMSRDLASDVIYGLGVRSGAARVGIVSYSSRVVGQTYLGDHVGDREAIVNALRLYPAGRGSTDTALALNTVRTDQLTARRGSRTNVPKVTAIGARTCGAEAAVAPPTKLLGKQLVHPVPPFFSNLQLKVTL